MRNKIKLYIGGRLADLDDGAFLLLNYTQEDLSNPTIIKNSFSRQIALKGTPANNLIFGGIYRNDRVTQYSGDAGIYFDPTRKTPFTIYNELNEILEAGYLKLDKITKTKKQIEYSVTLYGGLGSFLYGLSYKNTGEKLTLADLDFGQNLGFTIDRSVVAAAWKRLGGDSSQAAKWDIINFAPCYNGKPTKPFDSNKALVRNEVVGLPVKNEDYSAYDGWSLVSLNEEVTEQEAKDYRSYLQRPVVKLSAVIDAICDPANNGGWTVNQDADFFKNDNPYWAKTWLTLPTLQELNIDAISSYGTFTVVSAPYTYTIPGGGNLSTNYAINFDICPDFALPGGTIGDYVLHCEDDWAAGMPGDESPGYYLNYFSITVTVYDSSNNVLETITYRISTSQPPSYLPQMDFLFDYIDGATGDGYKNGELFSFPVSISQYGASKVKIEMSTDSLAWGHLNGSPWVDAAWPYNTSDVNDGIACTIGYVRDETVFSWQAITSSTARTGASIPQSALLAGDHTPADYLLSFCKTFGLQMVCHKNEKVVDIVLRKNLYSGGNIDIGGRVDRGRAIEKVPYSFDARWYLFGNSVAGEFGEYYENKYGRPFGQFRVNTGYEFDADDHNMTEAILFNPGCEVLETSKYFCDIVQNGYPVPAIFQGGGKYTLYKGGETKDFDLPLLIAGRKTWYNPSYPMHDDLPKLQVHGTDNAHLDQRDTILFFGGMATPASSHISLTDDVRVMLALNGNTPCWLPGYCDYNSGWKLSSIPRFSRYLWLGTTILSQLDWGDPVELQIPGATMAGGTNIFAQYWDKYISDRYDDDSAVVTCWVDLRGMKVDENLFRQFYYFDGALWALNRIINHSLTTSGPTQCEFVKVQDKTNYTSI